MAAPTLKELCLEQLVASAPRFLELQWSDGRFELQPEHATEEWNQFHQQYVLAAALLYTTEHSANPWHRDPRLWQAILRNGRHLVSRVDAEGAMRWVLNGHSFPFVCQRLLTAWLLAYEMVEAQLPEEDARAWRETLLRASEWLYARRVAPYREVRKFTSHEDGVNTGTNHFALYLSLFYRLGVRFDRPEWSAVATDLMRRLIAAQAPAGYWPEHHGPAVGYNTLTYHGVDEYSAWSGDAAGVEALRRGLELHRHWTYPDGTVVECIDGRMRHITAPFLWGLGGFSRWPEGRGYVRLLLEQGRAHALGGEDAAKLAQAYLLLHEGEEEAPPQRQARYRAVLEECSVVRKEGPWVAALSGQCSPNWEDNPYVLDRQCLLSVWREGTGLVLDGSNSKRQPELATLRRGEDSLPRSARPLPGEANEEALEVQYASFTARLRIRFVDARTFDIVAALPGGPGLITLAPAVSFGEEIAVRFSRGRFTHTLGEVPFSYDVAENGGELAFRGMRLLLPGGARVSYPISPFNSYRPDNTSPPQANRLTVSCPVSSSGVAFRLQVSE